MVARLRAPLPDGADVLAFTKEAPPASWRAAPPVEGVPPAVEAELRATLAAIGLPDAELALAGGGGTVWARAHRVLQRAEEGTEESRVVDLVVADGALRIVSDEVAWSYLPVTGPQVARDLDGDGRVESLWGDACARSVRDATGAVRATTENRCCGC